MVLNSIESINFDYKKPSTILNVKGCNRYLQRYQIAALSHNNVNHKAIAKFAGCDITTVYRWKSRIADESSLYDLPRIGRPLIYNEDIRLKTIAFYCQVSPLPGCNTWTLRWAEEYLKEHSEILGCAISHATIQRILVSHGLRPHLHKYFLTITDPDFFSKMDLIVKLYLNQPEYLFCYDECTGLQAKAPLCPDLPADTNKPRCEEFEYVRNGTTDVMAFFNPKNGQIFAKCTTNHNTQTLIRVFTEHVNTLPCNASIHYVMDNLNTHFNEEFCKSVADLSNVTYTPLKTGAERRQWLQSENKRIVIHFVPFHGSWLNMIEIWFGILSKNCIRHQSFESVPVLQETIGEFRDTWNNSFAHPFTWKYNGEGLHEKAISRFTKLLLIQSPQLDIKFLAKQLSLMFNIIEKYNSKVKINMWQKLQSLLSEKKLYIDSVIINSDVKDSQKIKARQALDQLNDSLRQILNKN